MSQKVSQNIYEKWAKEVSLENCAKSGWKYLQCYMHLWCQLLLVLSPKTWWNLAISVRVRDGNWSIILTQSCWSQCGLKPTVQQRLFKSLYSVHMLSASCIPHHVQYCLWWNWAHSTSSTSLPKCLLPSLVAVCCASPQCDTTSSCYSQTSQQLSGEHFKIGAIILLLWNRPTPEHSTLISCFSAFRQH